MLNRKQREALWRARIQIITTVTLVFNICKAAFGIWHSMLWATANMHFQGSDGHLPNPFTFAARPSPGALSELPRVSQRERVHQWLDTADISDEPIAGYHDLFVQIMEMEHDLDLLEAYIDRVTSRRRDDAWSETNVEFQAYPQSLVSDDTRQVEVGSDSPSVFTDTTTDSTGRTAI